MPANPRRLKLAWKEGKLGLLAHSLLIQELASNKGHCCVTGSNEQKAAILLITHS